MIRRIVLALVVGAVVFLACMLLGPLLASTGISFIVVVGDFLARYAGLIGLLAALWYFFAGGFSFTRPT